MSDAQRQSRLSAPKGASSSTGIQPPQQMPVPEFPDVEESSWDVPTKRTVVVILLVAMIGIFWISRPVIPILVVAGIVAYIFSPIVDLCERLRIPRAVTTIILFMLLLVGVVIAPLLLAPVLVAQLASLNFDVPTTAGNFLIRLGVMLNNLPETVDILGFQVPLDGVTQQIETSFQEFVFVPTLAEILNYFQQLISTATNVVSSTAAIGVVVVNSVFQVLLTFLLIFFMSLYLTKDAPGIRSYIEGLFPRSYQSEWVELLRRMGFVWQAFFRGQLILSLTVGVVTWIVLELAGMPGALILGILAGALEIVPSLGPILSMIPAVIIALIQGSDVLSVSNFGFALITVAIYFIIQQLENNLLVPRIIGGGVDLHPIVVLSGVVIGFNVAGILGALFAAPVIASLRVLGGYVHAKLLDYPPFQNPIPPRRKNRIYTYRRTVTGSELVESEKPRKIEHSSDEENQEPEADESGENSSTSRQLAPGMQSKL